MPGENKMRKVDRRNATTRQEEIWNCHGPEMLPGSKSFNVISKTSPGENPGTRVAGPGTFQAK